MNTPRIIDAKVTNENGRYVVTPVWSGVDRPETGSISTGKTSTLAFRLAQAMKSGQAYERVEVVTDVNGKTFVSALPRFRGRCLNADLLRLGF